MGDGLDLQLQNALDDVALLIKVRRIWRRKCWQPVGAHIHLQKHQGGSKVGIIVGPLDPGDDMLGQEVAIDVGDDLFADVKEQMRHF